MSTPKILTTQLGKHEGQTASLQGHAQAVKDMGNLVFVTIRDGAGVAQVVIEDAEALQSARGLTVESPFVVVGKVVQAPSKNRAYEIRAEQIEVKAVASSSLPIEIGKQTKMDTLTVSTMLDYRPLTLRNPKVRSIFKIEAAICRAFGEFLESERFVQIHSPKIVSTGTEGGAQLFKLDYFERTAYLAQSPQFYKQMMVGAFERVYEIGPVYRAEEHDSTRHLNEYISLDLEMGFIESEQDVIAMQIKLLQHIFAHVEKTCASELEMYGAKVPEFSTIPQLTLSEAHTLLTGKLGWKSTQSSLDLDPEGERLLCEHFSKTENIELVYLTQYPIEVRPFYAMPMKQSSGGAEETVFSHSFDLLYKGLEITTGGQRVHQYEQLVEAMRGRNLEPKKFEDYLQCFRYGMPPHGGLAIGLERLTKQLLGLPSVKLTALFPRDLNRLTP